MNPKDISRRDFNRLSVAALGGVVTGSLLVGCKSSDKGMAELTPGEKILIAGDVNTCKGLNQCKGHKGGSNGCAGSGACATAKAHACRGHNECKGQGGCGAHPGENECAGKGHCAVPLKEKAWKTARHNCEVAMTKAGRPYGKAPN